MEILYLIGNGLDIAQGFNTRYTDFYNVIKGGYQTVFELILMDGELQEIRTRTEAGYLPLNERNQQQPKTSSGLITRTSLKSG